MRPLAQAPPSVQRPTLTAGSLRQSPLRACSPEREGLDRAVGVEGGRFQRRFVVGQGGGDRQAQQAQRLGLAPDAAVELVAQAP